MVKRLCSQHFKLTLLLLFLGTSSLLAQEEVNLQAENQLLSQFLTELADQSRIDFSYSEQLIENRRISLNYQGPIGEGLWQVLSDQSGLLFQQIAPRQVIIRLPSPREELCGRLLDAETGLPLAYATLLLPYTGQGYTTDEEGFFKIQNKALSKGVHIQYIGYQDLDLHPLDFLDECGDYQLAPQVESLGEVIVRSYLAQGINRGQDGRFRLQTAVQEVLPGMVEADIFQSAQWIPGVTSVNETVTDIQIRGGSPDQNLILYDGIRLYNTGHFFGMLSIFNPNITSKAELFKGGAQAEYGDRISGVIDIQGVENIPDKTRLGLGLNGTQADIFLKTPLSSKWGLVASARRSYADLGGLRTPTFTALSDKVFQNTVVGENDTTTENEDGIVEGQETFFFFDTYAKILWQPTTKDSLYLSGLRTKNDLNFRLLLDENTEQDILSTENLGFSARWSHVFNPRLKAAIQGYYSDFQSSYQNQFASDTAVEEFNRRQNNIQDQGVSVLLEQKLSERSQLKTGLQLQESDVFYELFNTGLNDDTGTPQVEVEERQNRINRSTALFGTYSYRSAQGGYYSAGLRANRYSLTNSWQWEPRINAEIPIGSAVRAKLSGEKRFQSISQLIEFDDTRLRLQSGTWTLTNDDFPLLESTQLSSGLLVNTSGWTLDVDGYYKKIEGLTSFTNGFSGTVDNYSQGSSTIWGLDVFLKKRFRQYQLWAAYSLNDVEFLFPDISASRFPGNNDIRHSFRLSGALNLGSWRVTAGWRYRTGAPFTEALGFDQVEEDIVFGQVNASRFPAYHRLDASARYRFALGPKEKTKATLGISLQNIYARRVPLSVFYRIDDDPETGLNEVEQLEQLSLGFTPNFLLRLEF